MFDACITPSVVCQPARASILTGQLCRTHGVHDNGIDLPAEIGEKGFAGSMAAAGYQTSYFGKAHFSTYHTYEPTGTQNVCGLLPAIPTLGTGPTWASSMLN